MGNHVLKSMTSETTDLGVRNLGEEIKTMDSGLRNLRKKDLLEKLKQCRYAFLHKDEFEPGQLVCWKDAMLNRKWPVYGQPAIVIEVLEIPKTDNSNAGTPYYAEPLDLVIGVFDDDHDWQVFHVDSRRFRKFDEES